MLIKKCDKCGEVIAPVLGKTSSSSGAKREVEGGYKICFYPAGEILDEKRVDYCEGCFIGLELELKKFSMSQLNQLWLEAELARSQGEGQYGQDED